MQRRWITRTVARRIFKLGEWPELVLKLEECQKVGQTIVLACGCFDVLHIGHARLLREAADLGDILVVGLNSDDSVRRLKGPHRPVNVQYDRMEMVASLEGVNFVTCFSSNDPQYLIDLIKPDLYIKGGDYASKDLPEASTVTENGGQIVFLPYTQGRSTTGLIQRLKGQKD